MSGDAEAHDHDPPGRGRGHPHSHASVRSADQHTGRLAAAFAVLAVFTVVQFGAGLATNSLALLSDAGHMLTDVLGIGMALAAIHLARRGSERSNRTFGLYRLEILAALANAILLFGVAVYVVIEAIGRFDDPAEVLAGPMLVVAVLGLAANIVAFALLREGSKESLNLQGAYLEVVSDTLGSIGVIVAAIALEVTGATWVDPAVGVAIGLFILPRTWRLAGQALRILLQAAPPELDLDEVVGALGELAGVVDVHDLHVWTLTSDMEVASAHLVVTNTTDHHAVLDQARDLLGGRWGITHATLQIEPEDHTGCDQVGW